METISLDGHVVVDDHSSDDCILELHSPSGERVILSTSGYLAGIFKQGVDDSPEVTAAIHHLWDTSDAFLGDSLDDSPVPLRVVTGSVLAVGLPASDYGDWEPGTVASGDFEIVTWDEYVTRWSSYSE